MLHLLPSFSTLQRILNIVLVVGHLARLAMILSLRSASLTLTTVNTSVALGAWYPILKDRDFFLNFFFEFFDDIAP